MKITILGATGFLGQHLVKLALARGYQVRVLVRNPSKLGPLEDRVEVVQGDLFDEERLEAAVRGAEAVISAVGPPRHGAVDPARYERGMQSIVAVLGRQSIRRYIHTGGAVHPGGRDEIWTFGRRLLRLFLNLVARPTLLAKFREWEVLKASELDWTLVRPPRIREGGGPGRIVAHDRHLARTQVNVTALADFMLDQVTESSWVRRAPLVASVPVSG
jgi:putative NADH-flavin reductase